MIVVVASDRKAFRHWLRHNIIPITAKDDIDRFNLGITPTQIYAEGPYWEWMNAKLENEFLQKLAYLSKGKLTDIPIK